MSVHPEIASEQRYVSVLYERLDDARRLAAIRLTEVETGETNETDQGMALRDSFAEHYANRLAQLSTVERGLCFGRLDPIAGDRLYIGRIGLSDDDHETMLVDWRAPIARAFYQATPAEPHGISRRRHLYMKDRAVVGLDDDLLDESALADRGSLIGEAALLASLRANRTGRLADIVATIQTEQDQAIRAELPGILVVQGGPGTGKTVVALHRVAYLLYAHRERLAKRGVLVIGPNPRFLRYIDQVLPSLGETGVVLATVGQLFPGIAADAVEPAESAVVKGDLRMVEALRAAVADRQEVPDQPIELMVDDDPLTLTPAAGERARGIARAARDEETRAPLPHNVARRLFTREVVRYLTEQWIRRLGWADEYDENELRALVESAPGVQSAVDSLWPNLTPQQFLSDLWGSPDRLAAAGFDPAEVAVVRRENAQWTEADVPLLDEAAELLGDDGVEQARVQARADTEERAEIAYAEGVMHLLGIAESDPVIQAKRAALLASRYRGGPHRRSAAENAAGDRRWPFGHVVVDEAQERSAWTGG